MDRQPVLEGELVSLRPLRADDFEALYAVASDPLVWEQHPSKDRVQEPVFRDWFDEGLASGGALAVIDRRDGAVVGMTRYDHLDVDRSEVEIGWTVLARSHWGGAYNGEMKRLMLDHAARFVRHVIFRVHVDNQRSQRAVEKLGAVRTGTEPDPRGRGVNVVFRLVLAALLLLVALAGCGRNAPDDRTTAGAAPVVVQVSAVSATDDGLHLHVLGTPGDLDEDDPCFERFGADVEETDTEILVHVWREVTADYSQGGCENVDRVVPVTLEERAGDRVVVDRSDGRRFTRGPEGYTAPGVCGLEDLGCQGLVTPTTGPAAACTTESYRYAVATEIDGGSYDISNARCDGRWAAFDVDFGTDACLPEAEADDPCRGARVHRTFWRNDGGRWTILAYQGSGDCAEARGADPEFPSEICEP